MRKFFLISFLFIISLGTSGQSHVIDSLQKVIDRKTRDTTEVKATLNITNEFLRKDSDKALGFARQAVQLSRQIHYPEGLSAAYTYLITLHQNAGSTDSALYYLGRHEQLLHQHPVRQKINLNYNQSAGLFYKNSGDYKKALPYLLNNLTFMKTENENKAGLLLNIGNTYISLADFKNATTYHLRALALFEKLGNERGQSFCLNSLGNDFYYLKQYDQAHDYLNRSLELKTALQDKRGIVTTLSGLGNVAKDQMNFALAEKYYFQSLKGAREMNLMSDQIVALHQLGLTAAMKLDYANAKTYFTDGLKLARQQGDSTLAARFKSSIIGIDIETKKIQQTETDLLNNLNTLILNGDRSGEMLEYQRLSDYYALHRQYDKALDYFKKHEALKDSVAGNTVLLQMKTLEQQFEQDKKEQEIELLKKDQALHTAELQRERANKIIVIIALISVVIISALLMNRYRVGNRAKRMLEMERVRNTIARDLHDDIGSTLSSINIISQFALKDANGSASHFQRIAKYSSRMMESMSDIVWSINPNNDSLEHVSSKMKEFASEILDPLDVTYSFSGEDMLHTLTLDVTQRKNLFLIFKEAINNAAKYSGASAITIAFSRQHSNLYITITDNGRGFEVAAASSGNGLKNMQARAESIQASLTLHSGGNGTTLKLAMPLT